MFFPQQLLQTSLYPHSHHRNQMRALQVKHAGGSFELVDIPIPTPGPGQVLIRVIACGICGGDEVCRSGVFPGMTYPRVPGHEVIGLINALGDEVGSAWAVGQRVGVGWPLQHLGSLRALPSRELLRMRQSDGHRSALLSDFLVIPDPFQIKYYIAFADPRSVLTGLTVDGGLAEYMVADQTALVVIPETLSFVDAAVLLCAGLTVFNAIRLSSILPGDTLAVAGIGGLGHLALQFGHKFGYRAVAISSSPEKRSDCLDKFGAHVFIDATTEDVPARIAELRPKLILGTSVDAKSITNLTPTWPSSSQLLILSEPPTATLEIPYIPLLFNRNSIAGFTAGTSADAEDALRVAEMVGVVVEAETYPLERAEEAFSTMREARYRRVVVL
ncbi:zinc-type alcohol dehydrogenase [Mycena crocata]|nr:zinc-type alcohol dehydrogenase [Mycena crocata]